MIAGVSMVRNEVDVIVRVVRHLLGEGLDLLLIADNNSTDGTREHLADIEAEYAEVHVLDDPETAYYQSRKMTALAHQACEMGAEWIVPFDSDEVWYSPEGTLSGFLRGCSAGVVNACVFRHIPQPDDLRGVNPFKAMQHREPNPEKMRVAAYRYHPQAIIRLGNHGIDFHPGRHQSDGIEVRHFQYRSWEQFRNKLRHGRVAMEATNLDKGEGEHWRRMGAMDDEALRAEWEALLALPVIFDPAPLRG